MSGVKGIIGMHRFNICLVVVLSLSCSGVKTPCHWCLICSRPVPESCRMQRRPCGIMGCTMGYGICGKFMGVGYLVRHHRK